MKTTQIHGSIRTQLTFQYTASKVQVSDTVTLQITRKLNHCSIPPHITATPYRFKILNTPRTSMFNCTSTTTLEQIPSTTTLWWFTWTEQRHLSLLSNDKRMSNQWERQVQSLLLSLVSQVCLCSLVSVSQSALWSERHFEPENAKDGPESPTDSISLVYQLRKITIIFSWFLRCVVDCFVGFNTKLERKEGKGWRENLDSKWDV